MDRIPLINPKLIKVSATTDNTSGTVLRAEVVSSTPIKPSKAEPSKAEPSRTESSTMARSANTQNSVQQEYKVVLKVGQQQLETISTDDFKKGRQLEVKVLPGPELKIINTAQQPLTQSSPLQSPSLHATALAQQLLADRIPHVQQQDLPNLIKQLSQIIQRPLSALESNFKPAASLLEGQTATVQIASAAPTDQKPSSQQPLTNQQSLANQLYQQQGKASIDSREVILSKNAALTNASQLNTSLSSTVEQLKSWVQQLPRNQDISSSTGLRNALDNAGIRAEAQLREAAQQAVNLPNKKTANNIFQQLQALQKSALTMPVKEPTSAPQPESKINLASIVKKTAKTLSDNSQQVLSQLIKAKGAVSVPAITIASQSVTSAQWQNPLLNNTPMSLEALLHMPLLQNPSSNNKLALSQILIGHSLANQAESANNGGRIPLNWPEKMGNDSTLIRNLQNLLGHIEREQIQQMQSADGNQNNNLNAQPQNQQWIPLLINHQQQLQLIEFFLDKEERTDDGGNQKQHWFVNLHFDLPTLGKLGIEICLMDNECSTTFWSESASSLHQLSQHIQPLRQRLTEQGIMVSDIQSRHGTLEKRKHNIQQRLIDVKT
tara:strand:+ start:1441 stop:3261 length:1821 start_codon:yes stop_codon:yes gene_type:complete